MGEGGGLTGVKYGSSLTTGIRKVISIKMSGARGGVWEGGDGLSKIPTGPQNRRGQVVRANDDDVRERLESELKDPKNFLEYFLPRPLRKWLFAAGVTSTGLGSVISFSQALSEHKPFDTAGVNAIGLLTFSALLYYDTISGQKRVESRKKVRDRQIQMGDREVYVDQDGATVTRLKDVDLEWILKRLERWGQQDQMPFLGPKKGEIVKSLVLEHKPEKIVEVGSLAGYSTLKMAEALLKLDQIQGTSAREPRIITIEKDWLWFLVTSRFVYQAADGTPEMRGMVRVWQGDAISKFSEFPEKSIDFLFLDAVPSEYLSYLKSAEPKLKPGAVVVADNAGIFAEGGLRDYLDYVRTSPKFSSEYIESTLEWRDDVPDGIEVTRYHP
ncbi:hypothetical protein AAMO2058_000777400 [Amorphochlora amoebiformis]